MVVVVVVVVVLVVLVEVLVEFGAYIRYSTILFTNSTALVKIGVLLFVDVLIVLLVLAKPFFGGVNGLV